jgi:hypothetical protein
MSFDKRPASMVVEQRNLRYFNERISQTVNPK